VELKLDGSGTVDELGKVLTRHLFGRVAEHLL
jgi:hypothetical protein